MGDSYQYTFIRLGRPISPPFENNLDEKGDTGLKIHQHTQHVTLIENSQADR